MSVLKLPCSMYVRRKEYTILMPLILSANLHGNTTLCAPMALRHKIVQTMHHAHNNYDPLVTHQHSTVSFACNIWHCLNTVLAGCCIEPLFITPLMQSSDISHGALCHKATRRGQEATRMQSSPISTPNQNQFYLFEHTDKKQ